MVCLAYKYELSLVLNGTVPINDWSSLEEEAFRSVSCANPHTKSTKTHFNYMLLNPTILDRLQDKTEGECVYVCACKRCLLCMSVGGYTLFACLLICRFSRV